MRRPQLSPALRAAYARTDYEAGGIATRIGRRSADLDVLLRRHRVRHAGFVTAWNPFSRPMPRGWNERMLGKLREAARGRVLGEGWGRGRGWAERHLVIAGDPRWIAHLARRFRQHALVMVAPGQPARIVLGLRPMVTSAPP
ncbi:DUF3293 domain-containing protein [Falsiroseomonas oryziterrae]|uniref:DUF3293 domain-containing protein n=1 Tax=Falsiroseomonas oryziterrae TaxID=2911368 RepID=UPI001F272207|nr:DUF3293 domain-containing protein [Roseomonas sp. NPKOSM-4]